MALFKPLAGEKSRRLVLISFSLSSLLPLLLLLCIANHYLLPVIDADQSGLLGHTIAWAAVAMAVFPLLSFLLLFRWIRSLENVTGQIEEKTTEIRNGTKAFADQHIAVECEPRVEAARPAARGENEIQSLVRSFNAIFETAADQLAEKEALKKMLGELIGVASDLTSELDFKRLFPLVIGKVTAVMKAERTSLYVIDWDRRELWTKVSEGVETITVPLGRGISGRVAETGRPINVADAAELPYFDRSYDQRNQFRTRSVLCLPIRGRTGRNIGVIQVINKQGAERFDHRDEVFLEGLASQVGIALENSLLHDELRHSFNSQIVTLSAIVDARHPMTAGHSLRVTEYALLVAEELGLGEHETEALRLAALLHDIGKIGIRDGVLLKDGLFTAEERAEMNDHPVKTRAILEKFHFPRELGNVPEIACHHHERVDGRGYPDGLAGDQLPIGSKILAVADVFDALTSRRDYPKYTGSETLGREPMPLQMAVALLQREAGTHFSTEVVAAFLRCLPKALHHFRGGHFAPEYVDATLQRIVSPAVPDPCGPERSSAASAGDEAGEPGLLLSGMPARLPG